MNLFIALACLTTAHASTFSAKQVYVSTISAHPGSAGIVIASSTVLATNANLQLGSHLISQSSVTAQALFGDGARLTGISSLTSTQTISGASYFTSSFTVRSNGRQIVFSTSPLMDNIHINPNGTLAFYPELHNSSSAIIPAAQTTNQYCGPCVSGSTLTIVTGANRVELDFTGVIGGFGDGIAAITFLQDGSFIGNLSQDGIIAKTLWTDVRSQTTKSAHYIIGPVSSGAHSFCVSLCTNNTSGIAAQLLNDAYSANIFFVREIK